MDVEIRELARKIGVDKMEKQKCEQALKVCLIVTLLYICTHGKRVEPLARQLKIAYLSYDHLPILKNVSTFYQSHVKQQRRLEEEIPVLEKQLSDITTDETQLAALNKRLATEQLKLDEV